MGASQIAPNGPLTRPVPLLGDFRGSRNNFTLLRLVFALAVVFGHAWPITGTGDDPLSQLIAPYPWIGRLAVCGFFAISGYLVTASMVKRGALLFAASRALRLYPAIVVYLLLAVLVIGPLAADVPVAQYFQSNPWVHLLNAGLWDWNHELPHAFTQHPFAGSSQGTNWTLRIELRCYLAILLLGVFGLLKSRMRANLAIAVVLLLLPRYSGWFPKIIQHDWWIESIQFFLVGSLLWLNRKHIPLHWGLGVVALLAPLLGAQYELSWAFILGWSYAVLLMAYRTPFVDVDRYGDISYGIYVYGWAIQQLLWQPGQSGLANAVLATAIVIPVATLSWLLVEKPALGLRRHLEPKPAPSAATAITAAPEFPPPAP